MIIYMLKKFLPLIFVVFSSPIAAEEWIDGFIDNNGVKIHYIAKKVSGSKTPSLLFVPGLAMPGWIYEKQLEYFSKNHTVVAIDPRSQGLSSQTTEGHFPLARAGDINAVVDKLELSPVVLIGWSVSVPEIVAYINHYGSEGISGMVMIDGVVGLDIQTDIFKGALDRIHQFQLDRQKSAREAILGMFNQPQSPDFIEKLTKASLITPTNTYAALWYNTYTSDYRSALPKIDRPTLIVSTELASDLLKEMSRSISNGQFELVKNAGHALFVDQPDQFNLLLEKFLERLDIKK